METTPDPKLLSLLHKLSNPIQTLKVKFVVEGVFSIPEEWKGTEDANPGLFGYGFKVLE